MDWFALLLSPKGTIKREPFAIIVFAVYALNIFSGGLLSGNFVMHASIWPYLFLQLLLTWIWYVAHTKRLRDAGRGSTVAATVAFIYLAVVAVVVAFAASSMAESASSGDQELAALPLLWVIVVVLFIEAILAGNGFLVSLLLFLFLGLPLILALLVLVYSIVTGARPSLTPDTPPQPQLPPA